jgi:hypothetical protein
MNLNAAAVAPFAQYLGRPEARIGRHPPSRCSDVVRDPVLRFLGAVREDA